MDMSVGLPSGRQHPRPHRARGAAQAAPRLVLRRARRLRRHLTTSARAGVACVDVGRSCGGRGAHCRGWSVSRRDARATRSGGGPVRAWEAGPVEGPGRVSGCLTCAVARRARRVVRTPHQLIHPDGGVATRPLDVRILLSRPTGRWTRHACWPPRERERGAVRHHLRRGRGRGGPAAGGARYRASIEKHFAERRAARGVGAAPHRRHQGQRAVRTPATVRATTFTGTAAELQECLQALENAGATEVVYQPAGPDIDRELTAFARMAGIGGRHV
jgi:hypothetical protein